MQHRIPRMSSWYPLTRGVTWEARAHRYYAVAPASPGPFARALEHRESTEPAGLEVRGERTEVPPVPGWQPWHDPASCWLCPAESIPDITPEPDAAVARSHEVLAIDGIPAATYPFLPTYSVTERERRPSYPTRRDLPATSPECSLVTVPPIEQPSVDDNRDRCE